MGCVMALGSALRLLKLLVEVTSNIIWGGTNRGIHSKNLKKLHPCSFSVPAYPFQPLFGPILKEKPNFWLVKGGPDRYEVPSLWCVDLHCLPSPLPSRPTHRTSRSPTGLPGQPLSSKIYREFGPVPQALQRPPPQPAF